MHCSHFHRVVVIASTVVILLWALNSHYIKSQLPSWILYRKMSDAGRKGFSDKLSEGAKPQSEKSYGEQAKEFVTDQYDKLAGKAQPNEEKSTTQRAADAFSSGKDEAKK